MGYGPVRFTMTDVTEMVEQGILPEDATIELLDGSLVYRDRFDLKGGEVVAGAQHDFVVTALSKLSGSVDNARRHIRTQTTLVCGERHAPIPDAIVLRGVSRDYSDRLPEAAAVYSVIEVADSSYERDSGEKLTGYARAGVLQYIIINLRNRTAEVYTHSDAVAGLYSPAQIVGASETLLLRVGEDEYFTVPLAQILP